MSQVNFTETEGPGQAKTLVTSSSQCQLANHVPNNAMNSKISKSFTFSSNLVQDFERLSGSFESIF